MMGLGLAILVAFLITRLLEGSASRSIQSDTLSLEELLLLPFFLDQSVVVLFFVVGHPKLGQILKF